MKKLRMSERVWGAFAHMPIIAIIWISYLIYRVWPVVSVRMILLTAKALEESSAPVVPLLLTCASFPILMLLRRFQGRSSFVKKNADAACLFNWWLIKMYILLGSLMLIGYCVPSDQVIALATGIGIVVSIICMQQAFFGVCKALNGHVYHYWLPSDLLAALHGMLCKGCGASTQKKKQKRKRNTEGDDAVASNAQHKEAGQEAGEGHGNR